MLNCSFKPFPLLLPKSPSDSFLVQDESLSSPPARRTSTAWRKWRGGRATPSPCPSPATLHTPSLTQPCPEAPMGDGTAHWLGQTLLTERGNRRGRKKVRFQMEVWVLTVISSSCTLNICNFLLSWDIDLLPLHDTATEKSHVLILSSVEVFSYLSDPLCFIQFSTAVVFFYCFILVASIKRVWVPRRFPQSALRDHFRGTLEQKLLLNWKQFQRG